MNSPTSIGFLLGLVLTCMGSSCLSDTSVATHGPADGYCADAATQGWNFYCKDVEPEPIAEPPPPPKPPAVEPVETVEEPEEPPSYTDQMMAFREQLDEMKHRAILEPTPENVQAYMFAQREAVQMASLFTETWQRNLFSNPDLDANTRHPLSSIGSNLRQDMRNAERETALQEAATEMGLMYVYERPETCSMCASQTTIVSDLAARYSIEVLPVSKDGFVASEFPQTVFDAGQLTRFDLSDVPVPFLALVNPATEQVDLIGAGILTQDVILERVRIIFSVAEGNLYE